MIKEILLALLIWEGIKITVKVIVALVLKRSPKLKEQMENEVNKDNKVRKTWAERMEEYKK